MAHSTADSWSSQGRRDSGFNAAALPGFSPSPSIPSSQELKSNATDHYNSSQSPTPMSSSTQTLGHSSSESFARTVSHEITWAQDDGIDPAWGLTRKDTDPFCFMGESEQSNSFPDVPPAHHPSLDGRSNMNPEPEEFGGDYEDNGYQFDRNGGYGNDSLPEIEPEIQAEKASTLFSPTEDSSSEQFFENLGTSQEGYASSPSDDEARFEEGIPLVPSNDHSETRQRSESVDPFGDSPYSPSENFFRDTSEHKPGNAPFRLTLDRKSTTQVLDSLDYSSHDKSYHQEQGDGNSKASTGVVGDSNELDSRNDYQPLDASDKMDVAEGNDEDLAAKWKAALDDEEFLVDDETRMVDPSNYFDGDEDGFLDDEPATVFSNGSAQKNDTSNSQSLPQGNQPFSPSTLVASDKFTPGSAFQHAKYQQQLLSNPPINLGQQFPSQTSQCQQSPFTAQVSPYAPPNLPSSVSQPAHPTNFGGPSAYAPGFQPQQQPPQELPKAQSFADKAKGGYSSPYDLPMDVVRPRKRASMQQIGVGVGSNAPLQPPAPRSGSMYGTPPSSQFPPQSIRPPSTGSVSSLSPPQSSHSFQASAAAQPLVAPAIAAPSLKLKASSSSFFEELPITSKPKQISHGRYTPQPVATLPPFQAPPAAPLSAPLVQQGFHRALPPQTSAPPTPNLAHQMLPPERVNPYATTSQPGPAMPPATVAASRYSPAPAPRVGNLQGHGKYAVPPATAPPHSAGPYAHQPRTSSPLAQMEISPKAAPPLRKQPQQETYARPSSQGATARSVSNLGGVPREEEEIELEGGQPQPHQSQPPTGASSRYAPARSTVTPSPPRAIPSSTFSSPPKRATSNYTPQYQQSGPTADPSFAPPRRAQTQSPGAATGGPRISTAPPETFQRPSSVHGIVSPTNLAPMGHTRQFSQNFNYITPTDGREADPLQRWKGCPIFVWGFGGIIVTSFPKEVPRYSSAQTMPSIVRNPGEVKIKSAKDVLPLEDRVAKFPGPLRAKGKKKEVLAWLTESIEAQEQEAGGLGYGPITAESMKRYEERVLLWKILRTLVEKDGVLEGNPEIEKAVRTVLIPDVETDPEVTQPIYGGALADRAPQMTTSVHSDAVDPMALETLRKDLLRGDREKAVWHAVDKRLWGHAMLISSTCNRELWKKVVQEFVRQEVKSIGQNAESLAALYEIFAGNWEDSIDELVPPSARAGLQMVSTSVTTRTARNSLDGLDKWKDTLALVLSNRSTDDEQALIALGRLLAGYGRVEAAHICYMFVRAYPAFGGPEEPQTTFALLGADHIRQPIDFAGNMESILLSEIYEFAASLMPSGHGSSPTPHLQAYKLYHAMVLADYGYHSEAQAYCTAIANGIKSTTKTSPYYHHSLFSILDDLSNRLQQSPKDSPGSWISKPSMEKVSGSMWAKFNSFVAGDDSDAASTGSGKEGPEIGPFARIAGDTPSVSRSGSVADLYSAYNAGDSGSASALISPVKNSRYAPKKSYEPQVPASQSLQRTNSLPLRASTGLQRGPYEPLQVSSGGYGGYEPSRSRDFTPPKLQQSAYQPASQPAQHGSAVQQAPGQPARSAPPAQNPYSVVATPGGPTPSPYQLSSSNSFQPASYQSTPLLEPTRSFYEYEPQQPASGYETPESAGINEQASSGYEPPQSGYEPPQYSGYEPPSSEPYNDGQSDESSPAQEKLKKKSFMDDDDDDDFAARAAAVLKKEKEQKEKEGKQKAADGKQAGSGEKKAGWFGGWFGKKDPNAQSGPIKAKLGEESSFYYDPELKRWVNKKAGATTPAPTATPPPPRSATARSVSGPPGGPSAPYTSAPPTSTRPPPPTSTASAPPSAPSSGLNGTSSKLDAPQPSRSPSIPGTPLRVDSPSNNGLAATLAPPNVFSGPPGGPGGPPSRPGTALSDASSIDDLLGPPGQARKGGTVKKGRAKRGYVDVMAK